MSDEWIRFGQGFVIGALSSFLVFVVWLSDRYEHQHQQRINAGWNHALQTIPSDQLPRAVHCATDWGANRCTIEYPDRVEKVTCDERSCAPDKSEP